MMNLEILVLISVLSYKNVFSLEEAIYGSECNPPIKCVNSSVFAFCSNIDGEEKLIGLQHCLDGQKCSESNSFQPCTDDSTTTTMKTTISPPNCDETGSGNFPAPNCNQYYTCSKSLWWWDAKLKTCPKKTAFDEFLKKCVDIQTTNCNL